MNKKKLTNLEKLNILLQPYIRKRDIANVLECTAVVANKIYDSILIAMRQKNYRILDYNCVPTKLFLEYCELSIEDFIKAATIEQNFVRSANVV